MRITVAALILSVAAARAAAQAPAVPGGPETEVAVKSSYTGAGRLKEGGRESGTVEEYRRDLRLDLRRPLGDGRVTFGAFYRRTDLDRPSAELIPDTLQLFRLAFGYEKKAGDWRLAGQLAPSLGGDSYLSAKSASVAASLIGTNDANPRRIWVVGLAVDPRGGIPVLPMVGAILRPNDVWTVRLLLPELGVARKTGVLLGGKSEVKAGLKLSGGGYRVSPSFGSVRGRSELDGRWLREQTVSAEAGAGLDWGSFRAELSAGWAFLRRFEYRESGVRVNAAGAPIVGLSLGGRF